MKNLKHMLLIGLIVAIGTQFYFDFYVEGFIITASVIVLPVLLYIYDQLPAIPTLMVVSVISPLVRGFFLYLRTDDAFQVFKLVGPDIIFYLSYGVIFFVLYKSVKHKSTTRFIFTVLICDFFSNFIELSLRSGITHLSYYVLRDILGIAALRTAIVFLIIVFIDNYKTLLMKQEHENRYRNLYMLTSLFKSESYYIQKNIDQIDALMKKSYHLHKLTCELESPQEIKTGSLEIAKDIHEVKKDYHQIAAGLQLLTDDNFQTHPIHIKDLLSIYEVTVRESITEGEFNAHLKTKVCADVFIKDHFYLMSIVRNVVNNGIEAVSNLKDGVVSLEIHEKDNNFIILVSDNGVGIKDKYKDQLFKEGFSTKFNTETGDLYRGMGLAIVYDMVVHHFKGNIHVESEYGQGTTVNIVLNSNIVKGVSA